MKTKALLAASLCLNVLVLAAAARYYVGRIKGGQEGPGSVRYYARRTSLFDTLPPSSRIPIVFAGDSITNECEWAELLALPALNRGIDYDTTRGLLQRIHGITALHPKKLFLLIGINDLRHGSSPQSILSNYREILLAVRAESPETIVYLQSILPSSHSSPSVIASINHRLQELASQHGAKYIDIHSALSGPDGSLQPRYTNDGVHLMGAGYQRWKVVLTASGALED